MINHGWYSSVPTDSAVISICSTEDCIRGYIVANLIDVDDKHWFAKSTDNILNLDFDDIIQDEVKSNGYTFRCISEEQAKVLHDFIHKHANAGHDFYIHCRAGKSRSQAVGRYIRETFAGYEERKENPCLHENINVLNKLRRIDRALEG